MTLRDDRARGPSRVAGTAVALASALAASPTLAEPLAIVQTVESGDLGDRLRSVSQMLAEDERLYVLARNPGESFNAFDRDPVAGTLTPSYFIGETDAAGTEPAFDASFLSSFSFGPDGLAWLTGTRTPPGCDTSSCNESGALVFRGLRGASPEFVAVDGNAEPGPPTFPSPDGRHLYQPTRGRDASIEVFTVDRDGGLSAVETVQVVPDEADRNVRVRPTGEIVFIDDTRLFVDLGANVTNAGVRRDAGVFAVVDRDPDTGRLTPVAFYEVPDEVGTVRDVALSPDRATIYATVNSGLLDPEARALGGVARFSLGEDGTIEFAGRDATQNERVPGSLEYPGEVGLANGRLLLASSSVGTGVAESLHLWTIGDDGGFTYRGLEQVGSDGVGEDVLERVSSLATSPDGAYAYVASSRGESIAVFALHADVGAEIDVAGSLDGASARSRVRVTNDGPATAHEVVATITADAPIEGVEVDAPCAIEGEVAVCRIDELLPRGLADIVVTTASDAADDELSLGVSVEALQTDLDAGGNDAAATVALQVGELAPAEAQDDPSDADPAASDDTGDAGAGETDPVAAADDDVGEGAGASDDDGSGGGCTVGTGPKDPSTALLALLAGLGLVARARRGGCAARVRDGVRAPGTPS